MPEVLLYKEEHSVLYLQAEGHITAALCADLRYIVFSRFDAAAPVKGMYVDLSKCDYMDSTFLGLLVAFNKRLLGAGSGRLNIVKPSKDALSLLASMSLLPLVMIVDAEIPFPLQMDNIIKTRQTSAELLLKSHESLMDLSEENAKRFSAVSSMLKEQIKKPDTE